MGDTPATRRQFLDAIALVSEQGDYKKQADQLQQAVVTFGSETPENLSCATRLSVGTVGNEVGLKLRDHPVLFSDIAHAMEDVSLPEAIKTAFPDMSESDWAAFARFTTLMHMLLNRRPAEPD